MPMSNYPKGFSNGVTIRGVPLNVAHPGRVYWVNNSSVLPEGGVGGSDGNDGTYLRPFSTLDYAIGRCTAGRGDIIMVMPGHIEAVTATSIAMDVAGVAIVGLGEGDARPLFNFGATTSTITISAANCSIKNVVLKATIDSVVAGITLTAAADGLTLDLETRDTSSSIEFISALVTVSGANNLVANLVHRGFAAGDAMVRYVDLVGCTDAKIDVDFFGKASTSVVDMRTTACNNILVRGRFYNDSAALTKNVTNNTTSTWSVRGYDAKGGNEFAGSDDTAVAYLSTGTSTALGTDGTTVSDSATTVLGAIGADNNNNAFASTSVVANKDGSVLERLEALMDPLGGYDPMLGFRVTKTSNMADGSGTDNLFTVTGRCLITHLSGEVTTQIGTTTTMKLSDVTNTVDLCAATTITSDVVGTMYALPGLSAQILNGTGGTPVVGSVPNMTIPSSNAGQIIGDAQAALTIAHVLDGAGTGAVDWVLYYKPLTAASSIVAAA